MASWTQQINQHKVKIPAELDGCKNGELPPSKLVDVFNGNGKRIGRLNRPAARAWAAMVAAATADGVVLDATDTYRDRATQDRLWNERYDHTDHGKGGRTCGGEHRFLKPGMATAACPGTSNHGWGNAVDDKNQTPKAGLTWLEANAVRFGWEWELASEVWHLHYFAGDEPPAAVIEGMDDMYDDSDRARDRTQDEKLDKALAILSDLNTSVRDPAAGLVARVAELEKKLAALDPR
jgi:LAS superfamily LD-carboxypeptidase LdcB